jgi:hypothetical protein
MTGIHTQIIEAARSVSIPGMNPIQNPYVEVLHIETFTDFLYANLYIGLFYYALYFVVAGIIQISPCSNIIIYIRSSFKKRSID